MTEAQLREVFQKTEGHCHFCGDPLVFARRGWSETGEGYWEMDHVVQRHKGGGDGAANCLPACTRCNRLRWHRTGARMRELLELGIVASQEVRRGTEAGRMLAQKNQERRVQNERRRRRRAG